MQKVKMFKSIETELGEMEAQINLWLATTQAKIISITGNISPQTIRHLGPGGPSLEGAFGAFGASDVFVIILYELPS